MVLSVQFSFLVPSSFLHSVRRTRLYAEDLLSPINIQALRGIIQLGKLRSTLTEPIECMSAEHILHK